MKITPIPAFKDNYLWLIEAEGHCYIIDPGDGGAVKKWLKKRHQSLSAILITHHHNDHIGGIEELLGDYAVPVYGPESPRIPQITHFLHEGQSLSLPGLPLTVMEIPGHTMDHIAYFVDINGQDPLLFCGDTLFAGGCGRIFDGTPTLFHQSLIKIGQLPGNTRVFCAHEYTLANLRFAQAVEPDNSDLAHRIPVEQQKRQLGQPTIPTTIAAELATNPFLRCQLESVKTSVEEYYGAVTSSDLEVFTLLRQWKDHFTG